jgi:hypothetical protein
MLQIKTCFSTTLKDSVPDEAHTCDTTHLIPRSKGNTVGALLACIVSDIGGPRLEFGI